ncbi:hypothetical protein LINPERHAP2_LOCUS32364 [Linum perenne]
MISRKLRETTEKMEEQLRAEQAARIEAEEARLKEQLLDSLINYTSFSTDSSLFHR